MKTAVDSLSYAYGVGMGTNLAQNLQQFPAKINVELFLAVFEKALKGDTAKLAITPQQAYEVFQRCLATAQKEAAAVTKQGSAEALAIRQAAEDKAKVILSGTTDSRRVRDIIFGKNRDEFAEVSRIVLAEPDGKKQFAKAVGQVIADKAEGSLAGAIKDWKYVSDDLVSYGLMTKSQTDAIAAKLNEIYVAPASLADKMSFTQRLINNAILGYAIPRPIGELSETVRGQ